LSHGVISDNWSLQNISELLTDGVDPGVVHIISPNLETDSHEYTEVSAAAISIEVLFDTITDIILRDQILVDEKFADAWLSKDGPLNRLAEQSVVRAFPFLRDPDSLTGPRDEFVRKLCVTNSLKREHQENVRGWESARKTPNRYLSQTIWGGAGMLARAFVYERGYTPHPIRKRLFQKAGITLSDTDAVLRACNTIKEKRASIRALQGSGHELYSLHVNMDPLPIRVIEEASCPADIFVVALQIREEYAELRQWLGLYQQSINSGDYKDIQRHQKTLTSISQYVDSVIGKTGDDVATFTAGIDILKIAIKGNPLNTIQNQFGVRGMINKLILGKSGSTELRRLLKFFGHHNTSIGLKVVEHFSS
jgi:hypothetical protein